MELKLPPGFDHVSTAECRAEYETVPGVIGVVVGFQPPAPTRGVDHMMTFKLTDYCYYNEGQGSMGVNVRIFGKQINLPTIERLGDVVLIRGLKRMNYHGTPFLVSQRNYEIMCFPASKISEPAFKHAFGAGQAPPHTKHPFGAKSSPDENYYVIALRDWASSIEDLPTTSAQHLAEASLNLSPRRSGIASVPNRALPSANTFKKNSMAPLNAPKGPFSMTGLPHRPPAPQPSTSNVISKYQDRKFSLLNDIENGTYVSLVGEVRKLWGNLHGTQMYLTDYTSNSLLFDYKTDDDQAEGQDGDKHGYLTNMQKRGWKGPFGKMTIQITLWPPHDSFANAEVVEGDIVLVRNVHITFRDKYLEGKLHTDRRFPQQVDVRKIPQHDPLVVATKARRMDYEEHKLAAENKTPAQSKAEKKKKKRKEKERLAKLPQNGGVDVADLGTSAGDEIGMIKKSKINANVIAGNEHQPCLTITEFIDTPHLQTQDAFGNPMALPFVNQRVRARVRVVDFTPDKIQDFARSKDDETYNEWNPYSDTTSLSDTNQWEWAFYILVEDAKPSTGEESMQLPLQIFGEEAINLLGIAPVDLRKNKNILNLLKEKLFTLWGDLEEVKSAGQLESGTSNKPFECCIKEFGVKEGDDWVRTHAIYDTRIK